MTSPFETVDREFYSIPIHMIRSRRFFSREVQDPDSYFIKSVRKYGLGTDIILVRKIDDQSFEIIDGETRFRAIQAINEIAELEGSALIEAIFCRVFHVDEAEAFRLFMICHTTSVPKYEETAQEIITYMREHPEMTCDQLLEELCIPQERLRDLLSGEYGPDDAHENNKGREASL